MRVPRSPSFTAGGILPLMVVPFARRRVRSVFGVPPRLRSLLRSVCRCVLRRRVIVCVNGSVVASMVVTWVYWSLFRAE